jgi:aspartyl/asparaginyl-tRNA synthetase
MIPPSDGTVDIQIRYQKYSDIPDRATIFDTFTALSGTSPSELRTLVIRKMELKETTSLAYSIASGAGSATKLRAFDTEEQVAEALRDIVVAKARARKLTKVLQIINSVSRLFSTYLLNLSYIYAIYRSQ